MKKDLKEGIDYYWEDGKFVFTEKYHLDKGYCCQSIGRCRHCPYDINIYLNGNKNLQDRKH
jgi:hypothetical protein